MKAVTRVAFLWHLHQPDFRDPVTGRTIGELLEACEDDSSVVEQRTPEEQPC
ncbi:MAG: hypothetical protein IIC41_03060 [Candidatus Marinimicrobia bacterium]|nr:hypothetical protein [Candidatus Neomarinimicrobiota bacterium]